MNISKNRKYQVTGLWLLLVIFLGIFLWRNLSIVSDMGQFMPADSQDNKLSLLIHETQKGTASSLLFVRLSGAGPEYLAQMSRQLKRRLDKFNKHISVVLNGESTALDSRYQKLMTYRYLLTTPGDFSVEALKNANSEVVSLIRAGVANDIVQYMLSDPQKVLMKYVAEQTNQANIERLYGVWFSQDKSNALLMIEPAKTGFNLDRQEYIINKVYSTIASLDPDNTVEIEVAGPGAIAVATRTAMKETTMLVSWVLTGFIVIVFWFAYRSVRLAFIAGLPLLTSIIAAMAVTQLVFSEVHGIVLAFGVTLLGVTLDYPLHLFSHLKRQEAVIKTLASIWPTLKLGVVTSIAGYIGLLGTGFDGLTQLSVFAVSGLIVALLVTRWIVPVWVQETPDRRNVPVFSPLTTQLKLILSLLIISVPASMLLYSGQIWSTSMNQISPVSRSAQQSDQRLRQALNAPDISHLFIVEAGSVQQVLEQTKKVKLKLLPAIKTGVLKNVIAASDILPTKAQQQTNQANLPVLSILEKNVAEASKGSFLKDDAYSDFIHAVNKSKSLEPVGYSEMLDTPMGEKLKTLLFKNKGQWISVLRVSGISDETRFKAWLSENPGLIPLHVSIGKSTNTLMNDYLTVAKERLLWVVCLVVLLVLWQARKRRQALWIIVPVLASILISMAIQVLLGKTINLFHLLSLLLVIGMGLDYSLFFNRDWKDQSQLQARTHAIMVSVATTVVAFGVLGLSDIPILAAIGQTVAVGILISFIVAQLVAIPAHQRKG